MKITIDIDLSPEEFREVMGWPDLRSFQNELMNKVREQMEAGVEGYDPLNLMKSYVSQSFDNMDAVGKMMSEIMANYLSSEKKDQES